MGFLGGALSGYVSKASDMKKKGEKGAFRKGGKFRKKKNIPDTQDGKPEGYAEPSTFKRGGRVRKTGMAKVHRGEKVLTAKQARRRSKKRR